MFPLPRCRHPNCLDPATCKGNQLYILPEPSGSKYRLHFAHHKNESRRGTRCVAASLRRRCVAAVLAVLWLCCYSLGRSCCTGCRSLC
jgi:hypothetical protein